MAKTAKMTFSETYWARLDLMMKDTGNSIQQLMKSGLDHVLQQWEYAYNSRPKAPQPKKPVGRPADPFQIKQAKEWAERVRKPLATCKSNQPEAYDLYVLWIEQVVDQALAAGDAATLEDLYREQPWQSSQWPRKLEFQERYSQYISAS